MKNSTKYHWLAAFWFGGGGFDGYKRAADAALFYSYILVAIRIPLTVTFTLSSSSS